MSDATNTLPQASSLDAASLDAAFVDRRSYLLEPMPGGRERRQFANSHEGLSPDARELAVAIDQYKLEHRRRFITYDEMLDVIRALGYRKSAG